MSKATFSYTFPEGYPGRIVFTNLTPLSSEDGGVNWAVRDNSGKVLLNSTDQTITVNFNALPNVNTGIHKVSLRVDDETSESTHTLFFYDLSLNEVKIYFSIWEQVRTILGDELTMTPPEFTRYRDMWQEILATGLEIADADIHNELAWPILANSLIGYLIVRDFVSSGANKMLASTQGSSSTGGGIKRVETGPVNTEWFPEGDTWKTVFATGGLWDQVLDGVCRLASSLEIYIEGCPKGLSPVFIPKVFYSGSYIYEEQMMYGGQFTRKLG